MGGPNRRGGSRPNKWHNVTLFSRSWDSSGPKDPGGVGSAVVARDSRSLRCLVGEASGRTVERSRRQRAHRPKRFCTARQFSARCIAWPERVGVMGRTPPLSGTISGPTSAQFVWCPRSALKRTTSVPIHYSLKTRELGFSTNLCSAIFLTIPNSSGVRW
jgi:hypothetical protein